MEVLYILGCHRSGSTILTILLGNHSDIFGAGELGGYCKSSGLPKRSNNRLLNFWKSVKNEMENNLNGKLFIKKYDPSELESNSYFIKHILGKNKKDELNSYYQYIEQLYLSISKVSNRQIIIDSSKSISKAYILCKLFRAVRVGLKIHTQYIALSIFPQKIYENDAYNVNRSPEIRHSRMFLTRIQV